MTTEPLPQAAEPERLTEALRRSGALSDGRVTDVVVESARSTILSRITRLRVTYDRPVAAPETLILKAGLPNASPALAAVGCSEAAFYNDVAARMSAPIVLRCFEALADPATKEWHLLLEDVTDTHVVASHPPLPPGDPQCDAIVTALARFHAAWWDDPRLGGTVGKRPTAEDLAGLPRMLAERYGCFEDILGDRLSAGRRALYEKFLDAVPALLARRPLSRDVTIMHGDAHVWNFFLPRDPKGSVKLFDWDAWRIDVAANDLAYMMATHWYPERRRRLEQPLLDRYHAALLANGVRGYDRAALGDDYRLSALWQLATPMWQATMDLPPVIWWPHLERVTAAVDDLGCRELIR